MSNPAKDILNMRRAAKRALAKGKDSLSNSQKEELQKVLTLTEAWKRDKAASAKATKKPN